VHNFLTVRTAGRARPPQGVERARDSETFECVAGCLYPGPALALWWVLLGAARGCCRVLTASPEV